MVRHLCVCPTLPVHMKMRAKNTEIIAKYITRQKLVYYIYIYIYIYICVCVCVFVERIYYFNYVVK